MAEYSLGTAKGRLVIDYDDKGLKGAADDFERTERAAGGAAQGFDEAGNRMGIAGAVIAGGLALAAKTAIDFEKQISAIGAVSGASEADLERLRKKALQLGADTSFSASEAALAMEELAKAGLSVEEIMNGAADATVALAAAGGVELPMAAELAADAMNAFNLAAKDLAGVADLIAGAANASSISVGDFAQSLKQVGAVANLAGISFKDTATALALMGAQGIKGSDAGTSLKTMLSNLQPTTVKTTALFKELGLITKNGSNAFYDARGNAKSLADISGILANATKNMTAQQKQLALETIFGSDAIRAAAILTKAGSAGFNEMAAAMGKVTAEEVAAKRLDNTAGAIEQLKGSAETAAIAFGTLLLPAITGIVKGLTKFANWMGSLSDTTKTTIAIVLGITAGILLLVAAVIKIIQFARAFMVVWRLLNISFLFSPIGLIIVAIIALIAVIVLIATKTTWFQQLWGAVWGWIKDAAKAVADWFTGTILPSLEKAWDQLWTIIKFVVDLIVGYFQFWQMIIFTVFNAIVNHVKASIERFRNFLEGIKIILDRVADFFARMREAIRTKIEEAVAFVKSMPGKIADAIGDLGSLLYNKGKELVQGLINGIKAMIGKLRDTAKEMIGVVGKFLPGSPAEEGPLSGQGYVLKRGRRFVDDFAVGILSAIHTARAAAAKLSTEVVGQIPIDGARHVTAAQATLAPVRIAPATAPSGGSTTSTRTLTIQNVNVNGTWDLANPDVPRQFVVKLHEQLDRYEKEHSR